MRKLRVCTLLWDLAGGGAERSAMELMRHLPGEEFEQRLAVFDASGAYMPELQEAPVVLGAGLRKTGILGLRRQLAAFFHEWQPDVVHSHLYGTNRALMRALLLMRRRPAVVLSEHNNLTATLREWHSPLATRAIMAEMAFLYRRADAVTAVSRGVADEISRVLRVPCRPLLNPLDAARVQELAAAPLPPEGVPGGRPLIVTAGRLCRQKAQWDLIRALAIVRADMPAQLLILGDGPLREELQAVARAEGVADAVHFTGFHSNPFPLILASDVLVMSSHWEGYCTALAEAMAIGTAVVSTDCDFGPSEFVRDGVNGLLTPVGDPPALAAAILRVLRDPALAARIRAAAPDAVAVQDPARIARETACLYHEVVGKR